jgi:colanic acid biosynthesis glycosyl transferase WcaI
MAHLFSFMLSSMPLLLAQARWKPDLVFVVEPPLFCAPAVLFFSKLLGIKSWLHIQDYEVDAAFGLGWVRGAGVRRFALSLERWLLTRFNRVSTISGAMVEKARGKGIERSQARAVSELGGRFGDPPRRRIRGKSGKHHGSRLQGRAGHSGRRGGRALCGQPRLQAGHRAAGRSGAQLLAHARSIHFVICGNGPSRGPLMSACIRLRNVHFLDLQPAERLNELLGMADIHVLPQRADAADLVMPSKLAGMLASGKAVIVTANPGTELSRVMMDRGIVVAPGDAAVLADAIEQLALSPSVREALGAAGRAFAESELDQHAILSRFEQEMFRCVAGTEAVAVTPSSLGAKG